MTEEEKAALNRRVAEAMGYRWVKIYDCGGSFDKPRTYFRFLPPGFKASVTIEVTFLDREPEKHDENFNTMPPYCQDPAAADLVRVEIRRRGWRLEVLDMPPSPPSQPQWGFDATIRGSDIQFGSRSHYGNDSPHASLCMAFLAAHDAQEAKP